MRSRILLLMAACLYYSGVVALLRWWQHRAGPRLLVLNYHRADGDHLRSHLLYLRRHFRIVSLEEGLEEMEAMAISKCGETATTRDGRDASGEEGNLRGRVHCPSTRRDKSGRYGMVGFGEMFSRFIFSSA